ncbi:DUF2510 domain-containing protein [Microbacterium sp. NPDC091382]|uniref:DUF2510 domain-containing protein n=1 Tax=Microbacterium sp. NPDC091382 TaxID=3364210 RepID=UPI00382AF82D
MGEAGSPNPTPTQGWYDDGRGQMRWWDGSAWTEHVRPVFLYPAEPGASSVQATATDRSADQDSRPQHGQDRDAEHGLATIQGLPARELEAERRKANRQTKEAAAVTARDQKRAAREAKQADRDAQRAAKDAARAAELAAWDELTGQKIFERSFGITAIVLYENGYARFGTSLLGMTGQPGAPERLLGASTSTQVQDKSAGGRAVAAGMSFGVSLLASNEKRLVFLTITTDKQVRVLKMDGDMMRTVDRSAMEIAARAAALIEQSAALPTAVREVAGGETPVTNRDDVIEQIRRIAELRNAGILTPEEFEAKKTELLKRI